eukprot:GFKZ01014257.1.p1 GENE.GFKZ01014257.1~~GFKZ01014257.1.p1  ORF type:complete len:264 (+),score=53.71 GFKZ01014257.1:178-969(+)
MARNEEKAQSMLSRYLQTQNPNRSKSQRRPHLATLCDDLDEALKWRLQVLSDIRRKISEIQDAGLDDAQTRDLNDLINKLLRERKHWDRRILALGGPNFLNSYNRTSADDDKVFEHNGYMYFGAAKDLPGVKDLMRRKRGLRREQLEMANEESNASIQRRLDVAYFGYLDDQDLGLAKAEEQAEERWRAKLVENWEKENPGITAEDEWNDGYLEFVGKKPSTGPGGEEVEAIMLERRKVEAIELLESGLQTSERRGEDVDVQS